MSTENTTMPEGWNVEDDVNKVKPDFGADELEDAERETEPAANVIFIGKVETKDDNGKTITVPAEPPARIQDGRDKIKLPDAEAQLKGFYHEKAAQIIKAFPKLWKPLKSKGK